MSPELEQRLTELLRETRRMQRSEADENDASSGIESAAPAAADLPERLDRLADQLGDVQRQQTESQQTLARIATHAARTSETIEHLHDPLFSAWKWSP